MKASHESIIKWIRIFLGPVLSLITFLAMFYLNPLNFNLQEPIAVVPAFLLSVIILLISQNINTNMEIGKASIYSDKIYEAVKNNLHIISVGSPEKAFEYIGSKLPFLNEVKNTSFNINSEIERAEEKFYDTKLYQNVLKQVPKYVSKNLIWKDIGDHYALDRFRDTLNNSDIIVNSKKKHQYKYKLLTHNEPQINFILLEYKGGNREVLFNWDFRGNGQDPIVLLSRDHQIIEMFTIHFNNLWQVASHDHDTRAVKSTSIK